MCSVHIGPFSGKRDLAENVRVFQNEKEEQNFKLSV